MPTPSRPAASCPPQVQKIIDKLNRAHGSPFLDCAKMAETKRNTLRVEATNGDGTKTVIEIDRDGDIFRSTFCGESTKGRFRAADHYLLDNEGVHITQAPQPLCVDERRTPLFVTVSLEDLSIMRNALRSRRRGDGSPRPNRCEISTSSGDIFNVFANRSLKYFWSSRKDAENHLNALTQAGKCDGTPPQSDQVHCAILRTQDQSWYVFVNGEIDEWFWDAEAARDRARSLGCGTPIKTFE
ncbi:MAG: hypothetical protein HY609_06565 [Deltaproteobacteria bacterium]|nr:hypothetical protein [Deltaproteobacteria bacterium]MBI4224581.1 hypothetical protein [Deltaproteobacteria bacterium]